MNYAEPKVDFKLALEAIKDHPHRKRLCNKLANRQCWIWSCEHSLWWRPDGAGYTAKREEAGIFKFHDAYARSSHAGPEKQIWYEILEP